MLVRLKPVDVSAERFIQDVMARCSALLRDADRYAENKSAVLRALDRGVLARKEMEEEEGGFSLQRADCRNL